MTDPMPAVRDILGMAPRLLPVSHTIPQLVFSHAIATRRDEQETQDD